ncbi:hypothetical protein ATZ36_12580 [Candidatus Endomicrobiellum trichonymphae]|jgi:Mg2+/Co2+ transporter CorC|uniref:Uncharacterized protein n=1 Tax=Endomicrobium trichonymphae TaxID=1408204 RepID=A0A1E5IMU0_ENDTX|nr:hypothetical protein ATZ36_12580 [Candidatus Endomicrobium trichonymphae]
MILQKLPLSSKIIEDKQNIRAILLIYHLLKFIKSEDSFFLIKSNSRYATFFISEKVIGYLNEPI